MAQDVTKQDLVAPEETPMMRDIVEEVTGYVEDYKDRERTVWQKIFPDRQQRYIELAKNKTVKARYEFQMRAIQIAHEAQLQGIQEMYNDFLVKGKAKIRKDRAEFFQQQMDTLLTTISNKSQEFTERMRGAYQQLNAINETKLKERQERLIDNIADGYYETVEKLIKNFQRILDEEIHDAGPVRNFQGAEE
jgi:hypothetical protein